MVATKLKTVISASRRTDLPACHYAWLQQVLAAGRAEIVNPRFRDRTYSVDLRPEAVHSLVLWSKNFANVLADPGQLNNYNLYFQYTINNYNKLLEPNSPPYAETLRTLDGLLRRYRPEQFNVRFDPVIITTKGERQPTPADPSAARLAAFDRLCRDLAALGMQNCRLTVSYIALYKPVERNLSRLGVDWLPLAPDGQVDLARRLVAIADRYGLTLYSCACPLFAQAAGFNRGSCIDGRLLQDLFGPKTSKAMDTGQRPACGCTRSVDIGSYDQPCLFTCSYCYAAMFRPGDKVVPGGRSGLTGNII
jgi:hypothetical protein